MWVFGGKLTDYQYLYAGYHTGLADKSRDAGLDYSQ